MSVPVDGRPIRWGILATGGIAKKFTEDLSLVPGAEVVAVGSRSEGTARAFAERHNIPRAYGSWQALAEDPDVDVVYVAPPHVAHHAAAALCLDAGKAVVCEKPVTLDVATTQDLITRARTRGVFFMEAMWMRANPAIRRLAALVADGAIGEVTHVAADFGLAGPFGADHRLRSPALGGGALLDLGIYPVTFAHLLLGQPTHVAAWSSLFPEGTDQNTGIVLGHASGAVATLYCGLSGETGQRATVTGTQGRIEVPRGFHHPQRFTLVRGGEETEIVEPMRGNGLSHEAEEAVRCLREGLLESPLIPHVATLDVMSTLDAIRFQTGIHYTPAPLP